MADVIHSWNGLHTFGLGIVGFGRVRNRQLSPFKSNFPSNFGAENPKNVDGHHIQFEYIAHRQTHFGLLEADRIYCSRTSEIPQLEPNFYAILFCVNIRRNLVGWQQISTSNAADEQHLLLFPRIMFLVISNRAAFFGAANEYPRIHMQNTMFSCICVSLTYEAVPGFNQKKAASAYYYGLQERKTLAKLVLIFVPFVYYSEMPVLKVTRKSVC